jgi:pimeloyl-ACP methyl ester carboxylesterase
MRIIFIPGFAEDEFIFSNLSPLIRGNKLLLNSWKLLSNKRREDLNVVKFAHEFIETYKITDRDILIGHSMGGWIAYHVKHLVGCRIIHIASMTSTDRIIPPVINHPRVYWVIRKRLAFNRVTTWISSFGLYHHSYSKQIFLYYAHLLEKGDTENIVNQVKVIMNPVKARISVQPDLRIHSKDDKIIKPPQEPYYEVPGDHFTLYTHSKYVSIPIIEFLKTL